MEYSVKYEVFPRSIPQRNAVSQFVINYATQFS